MVYPAFATLSVRIGRAAETCFGGHMIKSELVERISVQSQFLDQRSVAKIVDASLASEFDAVPKTALAGQRTRTGKN